MRRRIPPEAFEFYFGLREGRSLQRVAAQYGVSKRAVAKRATKERWAEKIAEIERKASERAEKKAVESEETVRLRHLRITHYVCGKGLESIKAGSLTAIQGVRALDMAMRQERLAHEASGPTAGTQAPESMEQRQARLRELMDQFKQMPEDLMVRYRGVVKEVRAWRVAHGFRVE